jgi:hypothetical protein
MTKFASDRPFADPETAAKRILEIANSIEPAMNGRICIELVDGHSSFATVDRSRNRDARA